MKILIAGASGMVGQALITHLHHHDIITLGRSEKKLKKIFPKNRALSWSTLKNFKEPVDLIIHLCGENIGTHYWTQKFKQKIISSRVDTARHLIDWIKKNNFKTRILTANAIGYYGCYIDHHSPILSEESYQDESNPQSFLQNTAFQWQNVWGDAPENVSIMRFGVILDKNQGMLKQLSLSFKYGLGAILGSGQQYLSWITLQDLVQAIDFLIQHKGIQGPINLVSPSPVSQMIFAKTLAQTLKRPLFLKLPGKLIKLIFGQMGEELLLSGQYVIPKRLNDAGFVFQHPQIEEALQQIFKG